MNIFSNIINIFLGLIGVVIVVGVIIRVFKNTFSIVKEVPATVVDKQKYQERIYRKSQAPFDRTRYVITFLCDNKKLYFDVSELSYSHYYINQTGMLKYKGSKIIDF